MANSQQAEPRVTELTQSIRLATTMTGGVSLAIWMGGVARKINLLSQASDWRKKNLLPAQWRSDDETQKVLELYFKLIDLLDVTVDTDVLSGTSAGGINAALLGYCRAAHCDLGTLRGMWLDLGSLIDLLRNPTDAQIPSLMYGDQKLFNDLYKAIPTLTPCKEESKPDRTPRTTVLITTTLINGETSRFTDSYGTLVQDINHRGLFTFTEDSLNAETAPALALAGRSTASFPAAFEPGFVPFDQGTPATNLVQPRPAMSRYANITRAHWVADGGLLDNQPLDVMLERIFDRRASGPVRRVLLFVTPSAGPSPETLPPPPVDELTAPLGLVDGLLKDFGAAVSQSIASSLRAVHNHSDRIDARTESREQLAALANRLADPRLLTVDVLADYRFREADILARKVVAALMRQASAWAGEGLGGNAGMRTLPPSWATDLTQPDVEQLCRDAVVADQLRRAVAAGGASLETTLPDTIDELVEFGRPAFDEAKAAALTVVRCGYQLARTPDDRKGLAELTRAVHASRPEDTDSNGVAQVDVDAFVRDELDPEDNVYSREALAATAVALARKYQANRAVTAGSWTDLGTALLPSPSGKLLRSLLTRTVAELAGRQAPAAGSLTARRTDAAKQLGTYLTYLGLTDDVAGPSAHDGGRRPADQPPDRAATEVALRLFDLAATQRAMTPIDAPVDQPLELIQLSADTRTLLDPARQTATSKLTGEQLHHFGAFYKRSWRANDWMWGRLDGAGWLVHLLLDPRRIQTIVDASDDHQGDNAAWFVGQLEAICGSSLQNTKRINIAPTGAPADYVTAERIMAELAFLDDPTMAMPLSVPLTSLWLVQAWQTHIAAEEIPAIVDAICDPGDGSQRNAIATRPPGLAAEWVRDVRKAAAPAAVAGGAAGAGQGRRHVQAGAAVRVPTSSGPRRHSGSIRYRSAKPSGPPAAGLGPIPLDAVAGLLRSCPVPQETLADNRGTPLMVRTVAKVAATTAACAGSIKQLPGGIRPALTSLHTVTLAGYRVTNGVGGKLRAMILAGFVALVLGIALAIQQTDLFGIAGMGLAAAGLYLIVIAAWQSSKLLFNAVVSVTLTAAVASLALPTVRRGLFGGTSKTDVGVVGRAVPWLGNAWWHPLVALLAFLLAPALLAIIFDAVRHRQPKPVDPKKQPSADRRPAITPADDRSSHRTTSAKSPGAASQPAQVPTSANAPADRATKVNAG